jgi:hypothetical protein
MSARVSAAAAVALAAALALTGCGASPASNTGGDAPAAPDPATQPSDSASDGTTDTDGVDGATTIPDTFPKDDVPLLEGDVAYATDLGTGWVIYIYRDDYFDAFDQAGQALTDKGFTGAEALGDDQSKFQQFTSDKYIVNLSAQDDPNSFGKVVCYQVVING